MAAVSGLGAKVRELRGYFGLTQEELAFRSGVPQTTISAIESGRVTRTGHDNIAKLAGALGASTRVLYEAAGLIDPAPEPASSPERASPDVPGPGAAVDAAAAIRYVEARPGEHYQRTLAILKSTLPPASYEALLVRIFRAWEANSDLALDAYGLGHPQ